MGLPFEPAEKQALLEAPGMAERCDALTALLEIDSLEATMTRPTDPVGRDVMTDHLRPARLTADVDPRLLEILVCPVTHGPLSYDREKAELITQARPSLAYPIRDGVPIMLPERGPRPRLEGDNRDLATPSATVRSPSIRSTGRSGAASHWLCRCGFRLKSVAVS